MLKQSARARNDPAAPPSSPLAPGYNPGPLPAARAASMRRAARQDPCTSFSRTTARSRPAPFSPTTTRRYRSRRHRASGSRSSPPVSCCALPNPRLRHCSPTRTHSPQDSIRISCGRLATGASSRSRILPPSTTATHRDRQRPRRWRCACTPRQRTFTRRARAAIVPRRPKRSRRRWPERSVSTARPRRSRRARSNSRLIGSPTLSARSCRCCSINRTSSRSKRGRSPRPVPRCRPTQSRCFWPAVRSLRHTTSTSTASCSRRFRTVPRSLPTAHCRFPPSRRLPRCAAFRSTTPRQPKSMTRFPFDRYPTGTWKSEFTSQHPPRR